jgi:hypothetical protein
MGSPEALTKVSAIVMQVSSPTREQTEFIYTVRTYNENEATEKEKTLFVNANEWDLNGIAFIRIRPQHARGVGVSVEIECPSKIIIVGMWYEYELAENITTPRSV